MAVSHLSEDEQTLIEAIREIARERVAPRLLVYNAAEMIDLGGAKFQ
jgi:hypothetical protein